MRDPSSGSIMISKLVTADELRRLIWQHMSNDEILNFAQSLRQMVRAEAAREQQADE